MGIPDEGIAELLAWAAKGGTPPLRPGDLWYVPNDALGIEDTKTKYHPAIIVTPGFVLKGSHDCRLETWGPDARLRRIAASDMQPVTSGGGGGLTGRATCFDMSDIIPISSEVRLGSFIGRLQSSIWKDISTQIDSEPGF